MSETNGRKKHNKELQKCIQHRVDIIIQLLIDNGFAIQRYDAISTNSVYLKVDYGVCNSIRISDHIGYSHLAYRYEMLIGKMNGREHIKKNGYWCTRYGAKNYNELIDDIVRSREKKLQKYGFDGYDRLIDIQIKNNKNKPGFWRYAKLIWK
jgi:hypothetical protein